MAQNSSLDKAYWHDLLASMLEQAKQAGATACEVSASTGQGFTVEVRQGDVETIEYHRDKGIAVATFFGQRKGVASTNDTSPEAVAETVAAACAIAKHTQIDPANGLAEVDELATVIPDLSLCHPWDIDVKYAIDKAIELEALAIQQDSRITNSEGGSVDTYSSYRAYANSHGFIGDVQSTRHGMSCLLIAELAGQMQRDGDYSVARDAADLTAIKQLAESACKRTVERLGASRIKTGRCPVLFTPEVAKGLIGHLLGAISGTNLYRKSSFLLDQLNQSVFPSNVQITEQPFLEKALGSLAFDGDGVAPIEKTIIHDGVLNSYLLGVYSARKLNMKTTGNASGTSNIVVADHGKDFADLVAEMSTGLVVTELMGQGVNIVTGDYSRGVTGFWVENGEIKHPVEEITIAGNLRDMFKQVVAIGNDVDLRGSIRTGSILIEEMAIAGT